MRKTIKYQSTLTKQMLTSIVGGMNAGKHNKKACIKNSDCVSSVCATFTTQTGSYPAGRWCLLLL